MSVFVLLATALLALHQILLGVQDRGHHPALRLPSIKLMFKV
ncbi:hypothetical protein WN943_028852 [Citrus x changshan-huyou]